MATPPLFVVPVDFAPEMESTVSAAVALAKKCGAHVHLLEVVSPRATSTRDWSRLENSIRAAARGRTQVRPVTYRGDAADIIPAYAQLTKARLVVIDKHYGTSRWRRTTRIVSTVSRTAPAPVLALPPRQPEEKNTAASFAHIVSAVDVTVASAVAVRTVLDLIRRTGARLTLVHALKNDPRRMVLSGGDARRVIRSLEGRAAHAAERLRRRIPADLRLRVDARITTGDPHRGILDTASEVDADLIVMGVPPRSRFDEVLFGSTLRAVLRRATIPVLVLPVLAGAHRWLRGTDRVSRSSPTASSG